MMKEEDSRLAPGKVEEDSLARYLPRSPDEPN
jgi:hypothetical protein